MNIGYVYRTWHVVPVSPAPTPNAPGAQRAATAGSRHPTHQVILHS